MKKFMLLAIVAMFATMNVFAENIIINKETQSQGNESSISTDSREKELGKVVAEVYADGYQVSEWDDGGWRQIYGARLIVRRKNGTLYAHFYNEANIGGLRPVKKSNRRGYKYCIEQYYDGKLWRQYCFNL